MSHELKMLDVLLSGLGLAFGLWLFIRALQRSESPWKILAKGLLTIALIAGAVVFIHRSTGALRAGGMESNAWPALLMVASVAVAGVILSVIWTPHLGDLLVGPLADLFDGGRQPPERRPAYSIALSKRRQKKPWEAIVALREQLARFPNDFQGVMLLASIQAEDTEDLAGAEMTLKHFCNAAGVPDQEVIKALTKLADWHLTLGSDEDSAREIMEQIMARFPDAKISRRLAERLGSGQTGGEKTSKTPRVKPEINAPAVDEKRVARFRTSRRN
jgi:uncharacterized membrane protein